MPPRLMPLASSSISSRLQILPSIASVPGSSKQSLPPPVPHLNIAEALAAVLPPVRDASADSGHRSDCASHNLQRRSALHVRAVLNLTFGLCQFRKIGRASCRERV